MFRMKALVALLGLSALLTGPVARAGEGTTLEAKAAFDRLKSLAGEWDGEVAGDGGEPARVHYRVVSNGSTVMETLFPGTGHEMISMYHLDGDELRMTHYCSVGNQPRLRLDRKESRPDDLRFVFDGGTNLDPEKDMHIHSGRITWKGDGRMECEWVAFRDGKAAGSHRILWQRK